MDKITNKWHNNIPVIEKPSGRVSAGLGDSSNKEKGIPSFFC